MRKILLVVLLSIATIANAQCYTKFKGVEIKGSIDQCDAKLVSQGFKLEKKLPGCYAYTGKFMGEEVILWVYHTLKTRTAYSLCVVFDDKDTREFVNLRYNNLLELLTQKYGEPAEKNVPNDAEGEYLGGEYLGEICSRWKDECGGITLKRTHVQVSKYESIKVVIITYWSKEGYDLKDVELSEDL